MTSHIQLVEDTRVIGLDGGDWSTTPVNAWAGPPSEIHPHVREADVFRRFNPSPLVFARFGARGRARIVSSRRTWDLALAPGRLEIFPADFQMDHGRWDCSPGELVGIALGSPRLAELLGDSPLAPLRLSLGVEDPRLLRLVEAIRDEIAGGCAGGSLYADGLSLALVGCLQAHHAAVVARAPARAALSFAGRTRVADYVEAHLGDDLRIVRLASLVDLGAKHFIEAFRRAFGTTPHRYVTQRRIVAARRLLAGDLPLVRIAYEVGFANQAHFTAAFRRHFGQTPACVRREMRGASPGDAEAARFDQGGRLS